MQRGDNPPHPARDTRQQMNSAAANEQVMVFPGELIGEMIAFCLPQKLLPVLPIPLGVQKSVHGALPPLELAPACIKSLDWGGDGCVGDEWMEWMVSCTPLSITIDLIVRQVNNPFQHSNNFHWPARGKPLAAAPGKHNGRISCARRSGFLWGIPALVQPSVGMRGWVSRSSSSLVCSIRFDPVSIIQRPNPARA